MTLNKWRDKYGKIFTIWLPEPIIILADGKLMESTFGKAGEVNKAISSILIQSNFTNLDFCWKATFINYGYFI